MVFGHKDNMNLTIYIGIKPVQRVGQQRQRCAKFPTPKLNKELQCNETEAMHVIFFIWFVRLLALRPLLAYCASLG
jgi:hypothetical protein